jgi:hypothetical protein
MNSKRLNWLLMGIIALLIIGLLGGAYGVNSLLVKHANSLTDLKAKNQALEQEKIALAKAKQDIKKYSELEKITKTVVPEDKSQAEAVREIVNIASDNAITLGSITFPASTLGQGVGGKATTPVVVNPKTAGLSQLTPVKNIPGVYQLPIVVNSDADHPVPYNRFISFLDALEHNRRTAQVSSITLQPDPNNRTNLSFNLTLNEYIKP